jgi:hypothetical protein
MRAGQHIVGVSVFSIGFIVAVGIWSRVILGDREPNWYEMTIPVVVSAGGSLFAIRAFRNTVRLSDSAIETHGMAGRQVLPLDKIEGRRRYLDKGDENSPSVWHLEIVPNDDRFPKLDIQEIYRFDEYFNRWFESLPDLDELDKHRPKPSNFGLI